MDISILGIGYVGTVSAACFSSYGHSVIAVDIISEKVAMMRRGQSPIVEPDVDDLIQAGRTSGRLDATTDVTEAIFSSSITFICVSTPSALGGKVSLSAVDSVIRAVGEAIRKKETQHTVVMRSTVPPGTAENHAIPLLEESSGRRHGDRLFYYSNPEFMREGTAVQDFHNPPFTLIGSSDGATLLKQLYAPVNGRICICSYSVAESVKYVSNAYHATKLAFANEVGAILAANRINAHQVFEIFCQDRILNISPAYLRPGFAFGGSCLPKDLRGFLALADEKSVVAPFLDEILESNSTIIERVYREIAHHGRQRIALFGLAFKPGTDDLRESPFVLLAERLIGKGFDLRIFDRSVHAARLMGTNREYIDREIPHLERLMTADPTEALDGSQLVVVGHINPADMQILVKALSHETVLDLTGFAELKSHKGIRYHGLCW